MLVIAITLITAIKLSVNPEVSTLEPKFQKNIKQQKPSKVVTYFFILEILLLKARCLKKAGLCEGEPLLYSKKASWCELRNKLEWQVSGTVIKSRVSMRGCDGLAVSCDWMGSQPQPWVWIQGQTLSLDISTKTDNKLAPWKPMRLISVQALLPTVSL